MTTLPSKEQILGACKWVDDFNKKHGLQSYDVLSYEVYVSDLYRFTDDHKPSDLKEILQEHFSGREE